jgi:mono/diheme cytochrome c family protein
MKSTLKAVVVTVAVVAFGIISGCGGGGSAGSSSGTSPSSAPSTGSTPDGAALYATNCAGCHGALATSAKRGFTFDQINARMSAPPYSSRILTAAEVQAIADALAVTTPPVVTPPVTDGATLYATKCAGCHLALASSAKAGASASAIQSAINNNTGGMGSLSALTATQISAIATVLAPAATTPPVVTPPVTDGATLYATKCAGCHLVLASSAKAGASASAIQSAINNNTGGMGSLSALTATQVSAISTVLAGVSTNPTPPPACGSCHAIPPATGKHAFHTSQRVGCATCHGSGYSATTVNAATHANGVKNLTTTIGWNATSRSCSNSCHGSKSW